MNKTAIIDFVKNHSGILFPVLLFSGLCLGTAAKLEAQSIYSAAGIGDYLYSISTRSTAMGGVGLAVNDDIVYNLQNPAAAAFLKNTTVSTGFNFNGLKVSQPGSAFNNSLSRWSGFSFSVKITDRFGIAGGIVPFSDFNFAMELADVAQGYSRTLEGNGGITRGFGGISYKVFQGLSAGLTISRYFGLLEEEFSINFNDGSSPDTFNKIETKFSGNNYRFGVFYMHRYFSAGGYYSLASDITGESEFILSDILAPLESSFPVRFPSQWGIGAGFNISRGLRAAVDMQGINFSDLKIGESLQKFQNGYRFAVGGEYSPLRGVNPPLRKKLDYRAGFSQKKLYVMDTDGSAINEYAISLGFGLPFNNQFSRLDFSFEIGTRGSKTEDLVQERFMRAVISIGFRELWFQKGIDRRKPDGKPAEGDGNE